MPTQRGIDLISCGASMKGLAFKAPSGVLLHPQPKVPEGAPSLALTYFNMPREAIELYFSTPPERWRPPLTR
jgi:hypothetical protein